MLGVGRSLSGRRWVWRTGEDRIGLGIAQRMDLPEIVGRLLAARGVGIEAAGDFLEPTLRALLPDPSVLIDMDIAADRLAYAVQHGETVGVFGDYDVDGACSAALMVTLLRALGCAVLHHVPDRMMEGYGPNGPALHSAGAARRAPDRLRRLRHRGGRGASVHRGRCRHRGAGPPQGGGPAAADRRHGQSEPAGLHVRPDALLCAAAVAFLTAVATVRTLRRQGFFDARKEPDLIGLLDLVALATVCDVMPLTGVNRALVCQGLKVMARRARPGVAALLDVAQVRDRLSTATCGFALGPRINAAGRIAEADLGLRLLLCEDPVEAASLAAMLDAVNRQRQEVEAAILDDAMRAAEAQAAAGHATLVISGPAWHPGVVGIVAGRIKERFNRPTCVAGVADGLAKGSGRSVAGLDLGAAVIAARQAGILKTGGGHPMAAGFSLLPERMPDFHAFLDERLAAAALLPTAADLAVEGALAVLGATTDLARHVERLAPFGAGNEEPVLVLQRARVLRADRVGREGTSIRAFVEGEGGGPRLKAMLFRARDGALAEALLGGGGMPLHLAGHLRAEEWNGAVNPGFIIADAATGLTLVDPSATHRRPRPVPFV